MADGTLGNLNVNITGDFSDLSEAIASATSEAAKGASQIEEALSSPNAGEALAQGFIDVGTAASDATSSVDGFAQASQQSADGTEQLASAAAPLAGSLDAAGSAAGAASSDVANFGGSAEEAGSEAGDATERIASMAEQFAALAEALAVTEALKEFGQEALTAFSTVQSVTVGLTQLTKSAQDADQIITEIKELASTEPFAFPDIAPTIQKMVALGVAASQIPAVMQAVADAASATGNSFQQVANSFDRMSLSGTANARSLTQLGISTKDLGDAMGVSATAATAMFKSLDQSQRIDVLNEALTKFAGAAAAQAQTLAGQWQIFQNKFEEVMVSVGEALAPVVSNIISFGETVVDEVQKAVNAFNELPSPVKDVVVVLGLVVAATAPLLTAVSALGFGIIGLNAAATAGESILAAMGLSASEAAAAQGTLVIATEAATAAEGEDAIATLADAAAKQKLATASAEAAGGSGVGALSGALGILGGVVLPAVIGAIAGFGIATAKDLVLPTSNINTFNEELGAFTDDIQGGTTEVNAFGEAFPPAIANMNALGSAAGNAANGVKDVTDKLGLLLNPLADVNAKQAAANATFAQANLAYSLAKVQLSALVPGTAAYAQGLLIVQRASAQLDTAQQALTAHGKDWADTIGGITQKIGEAQEKFQSLVAVFGQLNAAQNGSAQSAALTAQAYTQLESAAKASGNAFASYQGILAQVDVAVKQNYANFQQLGAAYGTLLTLQQQGVDVTAQLADVYGKWQAAAKSVGESISTSAGVMAQLTQAASAQTDALQSTAGAFIKLAAIQQPTEQQQLALGAAFKTVMTDAEAMGVSVTQAGDSLVFAAKAGTTATPALQAFINTMNNQFASAKGLISVNGTLQATIAGLFGAYNQATQGANNAAEATKNVQSATIAHTQSMSDQIQALQAQANQLNVTVHAIQNAASAMSNVTILTKNYQIAANDATQNIQNLLDAFNNLNSTQATTADEQIALDKSFAAVQAAANALGLKVQFIGNQLVFATTSSTNALPAFQKLVSTLNGTASSASGAANQITNVGSAAQKTTQDLGALVGMAKEVSDALDKIGMGGQGGGGTWNVLPGSQISSGEPSAAGTPFGSQTGIVPIPPDPDPGSDYFDPLTGTWRSIPSGYTSINKTTSGVSGYGAAPTPQPTNNPSPFPTTGAAGMVALGAAVDGATAAVQGVTAAATSAATPLGDFGAAIPAATTAVTQVAAALASTSHQASEYQTAQENASGATDAYATATANLVNAQNAFTNGIASGDDAGTLNGLWVAFQDASTALENMTGESQVAGSSFKQLATALSTSVTAQDLYGSDIDDASTLAGQNQTAQAALVNAQNAYTNALTSGTDTQDQLNQLAAAAQAAQKQVFATTGLSQVSNDNTGPGVAIPAAPTQPPSGGDPTGKWQWSGSAWVWVGGLNPLSAQVGGVPANIANQAIGPSGPTQIDPSGYVAPTSGSSAAPLPSGVSLSLTVNAGNVVGAGGMQQLTNQIMANVTTLLRQAGNK